MSRHLRGAVILVALVALAGIDAAPAAAQGAGLSLVASPSPATTNQPVSLFAAVNPNGGSAQGTIAFTAGGQAIAGCPAAPVSTASPTATCATSFAAAASPVALAAAFTPAAGSTETGATAATTLTVGKTATQGAVVTPSAVVRTGTSVTYTATVTPASPGPVDPSGTVSVQDGGKAISGCGAKRLIASGTGAYVTCTTTPRAGNQRLTVVYRGDQNFTGSTSPVTPVSVQGPTVIGSVLATMQWSFFYAPSYSRVLNLRVFSAPSGASVDLTCAGGGCPFGAQSSQVVRHSSCRLALGRRCASLGAGTIQLAGAFGSRRVRVGGRVGVAIVRPHYVGKYYRFVFRSRRGPAVTVSCLAPGATHPGKPC